MSTGKTLSNGTLSLRFMQNAQRAKQQAAIDIERAKVMDEAEWEVSREIREAWGLTSSSKLDSEQTIVQETSYLPFLFPSLRNDGTSNEAADEVVSSTTKVSGRRTFVKGREILVNSSSTDGPSEGGDKRYADAPVRQEVDAAKPSGLQKERRKARVVGPLTGKKATAKMAELGRVDLMASRRPYTASDVPVLSMISEETPAAVGTDLRQTRKLKGKVKERETEFGSEKVSALEEEEGKQSVEPASRDHRTLLNGVGKGPLSFMRPAGVDSPAHPTPGGTLGKRREREHDDDNADGEVNVAPHRGKMDREGLSAAASDAADGQHQVTKTKRKQLKVKSGLSMPLL